MPKVKLTEESIKHLLKVAATGLLTQQQIAEDWEISEGYVSRLVSGKYRRVFKKAKKGPSLVSLAS